MAHEISLDKAILMTTEYRKFKDQILSEAYKGKNILPICETFDRSAIDRILAQDRCKSFRIYYSMDERQQVHAILVGVDAEDRDILPKEEARMEGAGDEGQIAEDARRCPDECPPPSRLNG
jgi:hypothetical protein